MAATRLHPAIHDILFAPNPQNALLLARTLAESPPQPWTPAHWLTLAEAADSSAHRDPNWWRVSIFAYEQRAPGASSGDTLSAMHKRVNLIEALGPQPHDPFSDPDIVFDWLRALVRGTTSEQALENFQRAYELLFASDPTSSEAAAARDAVLEGRRLREAGRLLERLCQRQVPVPADLVPWLRWAGVREEEGQVIAPPRG